MDELEQSSKDENAGGLLGLPESEMELDNLTEFNTAHNRRITMLGITDDASKKRPRKIRITFKEDEDVINPEDVDPTIGRFRNMIQTTVIPKKRPHPGPAGDTGIPHLSSAPAVKRPVTSLTSPNKQGLYDGLDTHLPGPSGLFATSLSSKLGIPLPNPAPDIDMAPPSAATIQLPSTASTDPHFEDPDEPKKKKYAKEAWPGKKPTPSLLG